MTEDGGKQTAVGVDSEKTIASTQTRDSKSLTVEMVSRMDKMASDMMRHRE